MTEPDDNSYGRVVPPLPRELQVEITGACNLRCRMCLVRYRPPLGRVSGSFGAERLRRLLDELPGLEKLTLQGLGEPLLAPGIVDMVRDAARRGIRCGFNTNGLLLTREKAAALLDAGVSWLHVSLDGATQAAYERVRPDAELSTAVENLRVLVELRDSRGMTDPSVSVVFVAMRRNVDDLPALVELAHGIGVTSVRVQHLSHDFSDTDPASGYADIRTFVEAEALWGSADAQRVRTRFAEAAERAAALGVDLRLPAPAHDDHEKLRVAHARPGCDWPWRSAYVTHDGTVQPCCMVMGDDRVQLGSVDEAGFAAVWGNDRYGAFRDGLLHGPAPDVCRGCSMYRGVF